MDIYVNGGWKVMNAEQLICTSLPVNIFCFEGNAIERNFHCCGTSLRYGSDLFTAAAATASNKKNTIKRNGPMSGQQRQKFAILNERNERERKRTKNLTATVVDSSLSTWCISLRRFYHIIPSCHSLCVGLSLQFTLPPLFFDVYDDGFWCSSSSVCRDEMRFSVAKHANRNGTISTVAAKALTVAAATTNITIQHSSFDLVCSCALFTSPAVSVHSIPFHVVYFLFHETNAFISTFASCAPLGVFKPIVFGSCLAPVHAMPPHRLSAEHQIFCHLLWSKH